MNMQTLVREMLATGLTEHQLAAKVPCAQSTISAYSTGFRGSRPSMAIGLRIVELHKEICGDANAEASNG